MENPEFNSVCWYICVKTKDQCPNHDTVSVENHLRVAVAVPVIDYVKGKIEDSTCIDPAMMQVLDDWRAKYFKCFYTIQSWLSGALKYWFSDFSFWTQWTFHEGDLQTDT